MSLRDTYMKYRYVHMLRSRTKPQVIEGRDLEGLNKLGIPLPREGIWSQTSRMPLRPH